jgi:hypothetical protein
VDTEDKLAWCEKYGEDTEHSFSVGRLYQLGIPGYVNPDKRHDKFTHDLCGIFQVDLKTVRTPLFKAKELYDIEPQFAITFNEKDAKRYKAMYPNILVIFDILWEVTEMEIGGVKYSVDPMHITVAGFLSDIRRAVVASGNKRIEYQRRVDDTSGNAKVSFVLDSRRLHRLDTVIQGGV